MIPIESIEEYKTIRRGQFEPLLMTQIFEISIPLRRAIISMMFPVTSPNMDSKYYHWMWEIKPHWCEECGKPLQGYSAAYVSHILTKGAHTEIRYDPLNSNILCMEHHNRWEYAPLSEKKKMFVFWENKKRLNYY